jgi:hypothetical protein
MCEAKITSNTIGQYRTTAQKTWGIDERAAQAGDKLSTTIKKSYGAGAARARKTLADAHRPRPTSRHQYGLNGEFCLYDSCIFVLPARVATLLLLSHNNNI